MNPIWLSPVANHLWQSTLFAALAGLLTLALRKNHARVRHGVWMVASVKFLVPVAVLIALGGQVARWTRAPEAAVAQSRAAVVMEQVSRPFVAPTASSPLLATVPPAQSLLSVALAVIWVCGFLGIGCSWLIRWRGIRAVVRAATPIRLEFPIPAKASAAGLEPGVFGILRPVLLLPEGIAERLTPAQLRAVIVHELCHIRHLDNLSATIQMFVETVFWFHPLVWWMGRQMLEERERACDDEVLHLGGKPRDYAEGILNICRLYVASPLVCVSGVTGADLRKRIDEIMQHRAAMRLSFAKKAGLAGAGLAALAVPVVIGAMGAHVARGQSTVAVGLKFEVASVRPTDPDRDVYHALNCTGGKGFVARNQTALGLIQWSYDLPSSSNRISGGPGWLDSPASRFEVLGKVPHPVSFDECRVMVQSLLAERFGLKLHRETREFPVYVLSVGNKGSKMRRAEDPNVLSSVTINGAELQFPDGYHQTASGKGMSMEQLTRYLSTVPAVGRMVVDQTGLEGLYGFHLDYATGTDDVSHPDIFTAVRDELGLKLEARKAPVEILVIDHIEKPSEN